MRYLHIFFVMTRRTDMDRRTLGALCLGVVGLWARPGVAQTQTFINDFDGWSAATGVFSTIDFETLPDGSPSVARTEITDSFNYTDQGATFSSPFDDLIIVGNSTSGFSLRTSGDGSPGDPAFIRGDLLTPTFSAGFTFGGNATLEAFDSDDNLLASAFFASSGVGFFLGITSDVPIAYVTMDENPFGTSHVQDFHFAAVPEPGTAGLLALGAAWVLRRRRRT
jgi:hypothetical protein